MEVKTKVLLVRFSSLGDLVHASAAIMPLLESGFDVSLVTKKSFAPLFAEFPGLTVYPYEGNTESEARKAFFEWYDKQNFSYVLDLHDSWRSWFWRSKFKNATVVVAKKPRLREWGIFFLRLCRVLSFGPGGRAKRYQQFSFKLIELAGKKNKAKSPLTKLFISQEEKTPVSLGEYAVFLPGSAWKGKEWPHFPALAEKFAKNIPVVVLGGEKDLICDLVAQSASRWNAQCISLRGKTSIRESMAILSKAKWIIGNDTGFLHVAEALGKDVAVLEGPTHESLGFSPYREGSVLLGLPLLCRPCSKSGKFCVRFGTRKCLKELDVEMVAQKLRARGYPC